MLISSNIVKHVNGYHGFSRVHTGKFMSNSRTLQGLHKDSPSVFKDYNFMKNTNLHYKILLLKI